MEEPHILRNDMELQEFRDLLPQEILAASDQK